jgi:hypothetical protein
VKETLANEEAEGATASAEGSTAVESTAENHVEVQPAVEAGSDQEQSPTVEESTAGEQKETD